MLSVLKKAVCEANKRIKAMGLVDLTFGNVSAIDRKKAIIAIKPSGVDYDVLRPEDIVLLDCAGNVVEGKLKPSSDAPTHAGLYRTFPAIGAIVHTHSRNATAFAQACRPIPCMGTTHADYFFGAVPLTRQMRPAEIAAHYELNTAHVIAERFAKINPADFPGVLVACHGPFAWGQDAKKAVENAYALECIADMAIKTFLINPKARTISAALLNKHFTRKHGKTAYYGQMNAGTTKRST